jgi:hypothetical protein
MDGFPALGGAVSTAGIGQGSHRYGSLADQAMALGAVLGTGEHLQVTSTREDYSDFGTNDVASFITGGMGQAGVITELAFRTVPIKGTLRLFREVHASAEAMQRALEQALAADDLVSVWGTVAKSPQAPRLVYLTSYVRDVSDATLGEPVTSAGDPGADPNVLPAWLDLIYPSLRHAMRAVEAHPELLTNLLDMPGLVLFIPQKKIRPDRATLNAWPLAKQGDMMLALGVFYYLERARAHATVEKLKPIRDNAIANLSAQPYFMDGVPRDWRARLGEQRYAAIQAVIAKADPDCIFARFPGL